MHRARTAPIVSENGILPLGQTATRHRPAGRTGRSTARSPTPGPATSSAWSAASRRPASLANETTSAAFTVAQIAAPGRAVAEVVLPLLPRQGRAAARAPRGRQPHRRARARRTASRAPRHPVAALARVRDRAVRARCRYPAQLGYAGVLVREHRRLSEHYPLELRVALAPLVELLAEHIAAATDTADAAPRRRDDVPGAAPGHRRRRRRARRRRERARRVPVAASAGDGLAADGRQRPGDASPAQRGQGGDRHTSADVPARARAAARVTTRSSPSTIT